MGRAKEERKQRDFEKNMQKLQDWQDGGLANQQFAGLVTYPAVTMAAPATQSISYAANTVLNR